MAITVNDIETARISFSALLAEILDISVRMFEDRNRRLWF